MHLSNSGFDNTLKASKLERVRKTAGKIKEGFTRVPSNVWEDGLGLNPAPNRTPPNLRSAHAVALPNRDIDRSNYMDAPAIADDISEIIMSAG